MPGSLTVLVLVSVGPVWAEPVIPLHTPPSPVTFHSCRICLQQVLVQAGPHGSPPLANLLTSLHLSVLSAFLLLLPRPVLVTLPSSLPAVLSGLCFQTGLLPFFTFDLSALSTPTPPSSPRQAPLLCTPPPTWAALESSGCTPPTPRPSQPPVPLCLPFSSGHH